jgi:serralysin
MAQASAESSVRTNVPSTTSVGTAGNFTNQDINGLLSGYAWGTTNLTFSFPTSPLDYGLVYGAGEPYSGFHSFSAAQQNVVRYALGLVSQYTLLTFTEITETILTHATLRFADSAVPQTSQGSYPSSDPEGGDVWLGNIAYVPPTKGSYAYASILHEIGHALGLKHGQEDDGVHGVLPPSHDSSEWSIMTYHSFIGGDGDYDNAEGSGDQTYMLDDIAALQYMYGANFSTNAGNTVYSWSQTTGEMFIGGVGQGAASANKIYQAVWDGGGIDTYNLSNYAANLQIDLRPGEWSTFSPAQRADLDVGAPGVHLARGEVANAFQYNNDPRSLIENAIGGSGNDTLIGNQANNLLLGGAGNDALTGLTGNDTLNGGIGNDSLNGGAAGSDTATYANATAGVSVNLTLQGASQNTLGAGSDTLVNMENLTGSAFNDILRGDGNANILTGLAGTDALLSGAGNDTLTGAEGNDTLYGGLGNDVMDGGAAGSDTASYADIGAVSVSLVRQGSPQNTVGAGFDTLTNFENLTGSARNDVLVGDGNANILNGNAGNDVLTGNAGNDTLMGGGGNDALFGNPGIDSFVFDAGFGKDLIADFAAAGAGHDKMNFSTAMFANYAAVRSHMTQVGPNVLITHDAANVVTLKGVTLASLTAADFTFHASAPSQPAAAHSAMAASAASPAPAEHPWADHSAHFNAAHFG